VGNNLDGIIQNCYATGSVTGNSFVGGIVGTASGLIQNCVALNESISSESGNMGRIKRTDGGGTLYSNYAWSGMKVGYSTVMSNDANSYNGKDITAAQAKDESWWKTASNWSGTAWTFADGSPWVWIEGYMPSLRGVGTAQGWAPDFVDVFIEMVWVPAGSFQMGNTAGGEGNADELPVHQVTLTQGFYMGKYEVTQAQYEAVAGINPSIFISDVAQYEIQSKRPVENVTWYDALEFCNKLSTQEGLTPVYTIIGRTPATGYPITNATVEVNWNNNGYRLPTEAEWEYAAKGGKNSTNNYTYSGSDDPDEVAWYIENSENKTHEVGKLAANELGLFDMSGNVYEWCWGKKGNYLNVAETDPKGDDSGSRRMIRGGCWQDTAYVVRSAYRSYAYENAHVSSYGFRLVRSAQ